MGYQLGVDIGTTYTAAAAWRDERVEVVALETHGVTVPTIVFARGDDLAYGNSALRRGNAHPDGIAREFKRRLGDPVPLVLSGTPYSADRLVALFAEWVIRLVSEQFGGPPDRTVFTHPANWTSFQLSLLEQSVSQTVRDAEFLNEPEGAALDFAAAAQVDQGALILVYDLGGGTFDVALLRRDEHGFTQVGEAAGVEHLGGIDFDEAVFQFVIDQLPPEVIERGRRDPNEARAALRRLRRFVIEAKEGLSSEVAVDIPVILPGHETTVRLTRHEFENMARPALLRTVVVARGALSRANIPASSLSAVLLVGGSSRIPCVSDLIRDELGVPIRVDAHPKLVVARGAARWAATRDEIPAARRSRLTGRATTDVPSSDEKQQRFRRAAAPASPEPRQSASDAGPHTQYPAAASGLRVADFLRFGLIMAVVAGLVVALTLVVGGRRERTIVRMDSPPRVSVEVASEVGQFLEDSSAQFEEVFGVDNANAERQTLCRRFVQSLEPLSEEQVPRRLETELGELKRGEHFLAATLVENLVIKWTALWSTCAAHELSPTELRALHEGIQSAVRDCVSADVCATQDPTGDQPGTPTTGA